MKKIDIGIIFGTTILLPALICGVISKILINKGYLIESNVWIEIIKSLLGIWGTLLGFIVTALSIILAIGNSPFLKLLSDSGHMKTIMLSYAVTSIVLLGATAFGIFVICLNDFSGKMLMITLFFIFSTLFSLIISLFFLFSIIFYTKTQ